MTPSVVYFVRIPNGHIKIGTTTNMHRRLPQLRARFGQLSTMMAAVPGFERDERAMHRKFEALRIANTEVFSPARELLEFINLLPDPVFRSLDEIPLPPRPPRRCVQDDRRREKTQSLYVCLGRICKAVRMNRSSVRSIAAKMEIKTITVSSMKGEWMHIDDFNRFREVAESIKANAFGRRRKH